MCRIDIRSTAKEHRFVDSKRSISWDLQNILLWIITKYNLGSITLDAVSCKFYTLDITTIMINRNKRLLTVDPSNREHFLISLKRKIRWLLNVIVGIKLSAHWKANVNKNVCCIKWKYIVIRVMIEIKRYILGQRKGNIRLGTITIERVSPTRNIGIVPRYLVMCGRSKIKKEQIQYWNGK